MLPKKKNDQDMNEVQGQSFKHAGMDLNSSSNACDVLTKGLDYLDT